ncbi:MAG TPA: DUF1573 domain-containing protein [Fimbriiglobus sp.]|nr:DUF1573 domain-containing protein [Fimbriiglobus sp.]
MTRAIKDVSRKPGWRQQVITLILIPPACYAAYWLGTLVAGPGSVPTQLPNVGGLHIDAKYLDLGEVWETPEHVAVVPVQNVSSAPITVAEFATSCDCSGVEPKSVTLQPGQRADLTVKLDLTHRLPYQFGLARRPVTVRIDPVFGGDYAPSTGWELKAVVRSRVSVNATRLDFMDLCTHAGTPASRTVRATAHVPLARLEAVAVPNAAAVRVTPEPSGELDIVVTPDPGLPVGPFRFEVRTTAVTPDGVAHRCATIPVCGEMQPATRVTPGVVLLGERAVNSTAEAEVIVRLPGVGWSVERIEVESLDTVVKKVDSDADGTQRYRVVQRIARTGDQTAAIDFVVRRPGGEVGKVDATVCYYGLAKRPRAGM